MKPLPLSAIVLTYNEEANIEECLQSLAGRVDEIFVVDSGSTDGTLAIARRYTSHIAEHPFRNWADQFNWAADTLPLKHQWIMRLDADERMTPDAWRELGDLWPNLGEDASGIAIMKEFYFMGRVMRHGGHFLPWIRLWRRDRAHFEERPMDEHLIFSSGRVTTLKHPFREEDRKGFRAWLTKHVTYAEREVQALTGPGGDLVAPDLKGSAVARKKWLKQNVYQKLPLFVRPFLYFFYRYVVQRGFLDGKEGFIFHFFQGLWYRMLVDVKLYELRKNRPFDKAQGKESTLR